MKVQITVKQTSTATVDIGDLPSRLIEESLVENNGSFNENWSLWDLRGVETTTDSIEVVEKKVKS